MKFSDKYPKTELFQEPMQGIYVVPDYYPCRECGAPTKFIDYQSKSATAGAPLCSEECFEMHVLGRSL